MMSAAWLCLFLLNVTTTFGQDALNCFTEQNNVLRKHQVATSDVYFRYNPGVDIMNIISEFERLDLNVRLSEDQSVLSCDAVGVGGVAVRCWCWCCCVVGGGVGVGVAVGCVVGVRVVRVYAVVPVVGCCLLCVVVVLWCCLCGGQC